LKKSKLGKKITDEYCIGANSHRIKFVIFSSSDGSKSQHLKS